MDTLIQHSDIQTKDYRLMIGDCLERMREIEPGSVDMILCDLPYGTTDNAWDKVIPFGALWYEYKRITKPNAAIILHAQVPFSAQLGASNLKMLKYEFIWQKSMATGFLNAKKAPLKNHENILVFYDKAPTYNPQMRQGFEPYKRDKTKMQVYSKNYDVDHKPHVSKSTDGSRYPVTILQFPHPKDKVHPTQKPIELAEYLIKTYTNIGETVLDNCFGSGTTGIACMHTDRKFIGIERDPGYFDVAAKRINKAVEDKLIAVESEQLELEIEIA